VVCDGVSSSDRPDTASYAAVDAAVPALLDALRGEPVDPGRALALAAGAAQAAAALAAGTDPGPNPPSSTFVAAVVTTETVTVGWVGDSRAYWLPDSGEPQLLSVDDSFAAEQIAEGVPRADAENGPQAHAITRWLGVDAPDHTPRTTTAPLTGPGWVLLCSDGLWNYCSAPGDVAELTRTTAQAAGAEPLGLASALVDWAKAQGGRDNITVALARVPAEGEGSTPDGNVLS
jgi:serine/threonine protein phosphatase PrpC